MTERCFCCHEPRTDTECESGCQIERETTPRAQTLYCSTHGRSNEGATNNAWPS